MHLTTAQLDLIRTYFAARPVKRAWLFGSYARGEADAASDVDLLVDLDYDHVDWGFAIWPDELKRLLGIPVDVISTGGLSRFSSVRVAADRQLIYENTA